MPDFHFHVRPQVWIGPDALLRLPLLAGETCGSDQPKAMLIADPLLYESKTIERVRELLEDRGVKVLVFDDIPDRASSAAAEAALRLVRGSKAPLVVALGGLKTMMLARAVAVSAGGGRDIDSLFEGMRPRVPPLPLIELPTSLRHPFMNQDCIILPDGRDRSVHLIRMPGAAAHAVLIDPGLCASLSPKLASSCIISSLLGAVEAYVSAKSSFMSDLFLEKAAAILASALDGMLERPDDPMVRQKAWQGSFLAALGLGLSAPGIGSAVALAINARWPVPKASLAAILLPYSLELAMKSRPEKLATLAGLFERGEGLPEGDPQLAHAPAPSQGSHEAAFRAVEWLRTRLGQLRIPSRLKDFDLVLDRLVESARDARELDFMNYLPRAASVDDVFDFIKTAF